MNKPVYEKNMQAIEKKFPTWANILREYNRKKRNFDVIVEQSYTDEPIMKVRDHGKVYYLNGKYAPSAIVEHWLEQQENIERFSTIIIIGISNAAHIKKIMDNVPSTVNILIYEPSYEIFRRAIEEVDISFIFARNIPVAIIVDKINQFEINEYFTSMINYDNIISLKLYISGNYKKIFTEKVEKFITELKHHMNIIESVWATTVRYTDYIAPNVIHNLQYLYEGYSITDLQNMLPENIPAIIVSAGPSLNKNINDLKKAQGKACIIATDTAMRPLLNAGIIPDMFVIVDGLKPAELFEHKDISKCPMIASTDVAAAPMDIHKGKKFFYSGGHPFETALLKKINKMDKRMISLNSLPTGGSVATSAYSLAVQMGAKTVILVGQDLALTDNKLHVDGAFKNEKCEIDLTNNIYMEVESVEGGKVVTRSDFKQYLTWFERAIKAWSHIKTIDATEGGAKIHGAKQMTLKNAIKKYCVNKYNVKWHMARVPKIFSTKEEQEFGLNYFEQSVEKLDQVIKKANEGFKTYEEIEKGRYNSLNNKKNQRLYKKIKKVNTFMEKDPMAETVINSLKGIEYTLRPSIYRTQETKEDELNDIVKQGKIMMSAIAIGAEEIKEMIRETLLPYVEKKKFDLEMFK